MNREENGRPTLAPAGGLRRRSLDEARRILDAEGEDALNLRAIAAATGSGVGSLYYYFKNKDALLVELAIDGFHELGVSLKAAAAGPGHRRLFHAVCDTYLTFTRRRPRLYGLMYDERLLATHAAMRSAEAEAFAAFRLGAAGLAASGEALEDIAVTFWALGRGVASISAASGSPYPGASKALVHRVLGGLEAMTGLGVKRWGPTPVSMAG